VKPDFRVLGTYAGIFREELKLRNITKMGFTMFLKFGKI